jgi:hypothetical protein
MIQRILNFFGRNKRKYPNSPVEIGSQTGKINSNKSIADAATTAEEAIHNNNLSTKFLLDKQALNINFKPHVATRKVKEKKDLAEFPFFIKRE